MKRVHVAAAVIRGSDGRVLIARRPEDKHQGGLWEFPGGKVEDGEPVRAALARELEEELGIRVERTRAVSSRPSISGISQSARSTLTGRCSSCCRASLALLAKRMSW